MLKKLFLICGAVSLASILLAKDAENSLLKEKGFSQNWIAGLSDINKDVEYSLEKDQFKYIGMPIGGLFAGQVYLAGDGSLWNCDMFNTLLYNPKANAGDKFYRKPMIPKEYNYFKQGVYLKINGKRYSLDKNGFDNITFKGEYPLGLVTYKSKNCPVEVNLTAYSPFSPTKTAMSSMPIVVREYAIKNKTEKDLKIFFDVFSENAVGKFSKTAGKLASDAELAPNFAIVKLFDKNSKNSAAQDQGSLALLVKELKKEFKNKEVCRKEVISRDGLTAYDFDISVADNIVNVERKLTIKPNESKTVVVALAWYFPNINAAKKRLELTRITNIDKLKNYYSKFYVDAADVARKFNKNYNELSGETKLWHDTWYDATLPKYFLTRSFLNTSTLATTVWRRFADLVSGELDGRVYCSEGMYYGVGTCNHVLHYEQNMGRVFPDVTRGLRKKVNFGLAMQPNGVMAYRVEESKRGAHKGTKFAIDGQLGTILQAYREYTMSDDINYLSTIYPNLKKAMQRVMSQDKDKNGNYNGIIEGAQYNTLDRIWLGKIAWISGLYNAALRATVKMAMAMDDKKFADKCQKIADIGKKSISNELFNGEYFYQKLTDKQRNTPNSNIGVHIDQMLGQAWAYQVGLGDILDKNKVKKALESILKYNFYKDYKDYLKIAKIKPHRYYSVDGEGGVIMCSFPKGGADQAPGINKAKWERVTVGYFSEMWTGQEYLLASLLIDAGMVEEGLAIIKCIDERYAPEKRNPYSDIEYGNHYTRAMSGYAPFISITGFVYDANKQSIGFNPKFHADNFKSAFITASGWGSFTQKRLST